METSRAAVGCLAIGIGFVALGLVTMPGLVATTAVACPVYGNPHFVGIDWRHFAILWDDGCNTLAISGFGVVGGLYLAAAAGFGGLTAVGRVRARVSGSE